jgi:hypothetical protein
MVFVTPHVSNLYGRKCGSFLEFLRYPCYVVLLTLAMLYKHASVSLYTQVTSVIILPQTTHTLSERDEVIVRQVLIHHNHSHQDRAPSVSSSTIRKSVVSEQDWSKGLGSGDACGCDTQERMWYSRTLPHRLRLAPKSSRWIFSSRDVQQKCLVSRLHAEMQR